MKRIPATIWHVAALGLCLMCLSVARPTVTGHAQGDVPAPGTDAAELPPAFQTESQIEPQSISAENVVCPPTRSSSQHRVPKCNDITYVVDQGTGLDTSCTYRSGGPLRFAIEVKRFPGDLEKLIRNKLISPKAVLRMPAYDVDFDATVPNIAPERDRVTFNGKALDYLTGANGIWKLNTFYININDIKFASSAQQPGVNEIVIDIDTANTRESWCTAIDWATLSIELAPPVLMVHGILSEGATWDGPWKEKLTELGLPFEAIDLGGLGGPNGIALDSIQNNAEKIAEKISEMRKELGVDHIRILSHSKGGIDSRHYIEQNDTVGTLVQLGTPNAGSPLADLAQVALFYFATPGAAVLGNLALPAGYQLTTYYMGIYNWWHGINGQTKYVSLAGDYTFGDLRDRPLRFFYGGPHDTIVPQWSVWALPYTIMHGHSSEGNDNSAMHTGQTGSDVVRDIVIGYFRELRRNPEFDQQIQAQALQLPPD